MLNKGDYIAIKCRNTPSVTDSGSYEINLPYYGGGTPEEWFIWKDNLLKTLDGQGTSEGPQRHTFTELLLTRDTRATYTQTALVTGVHKVE